MAAVTANNRFSIRNYTATMRIADVDSPQPPIPVKWYRWWADDLIPAGDNITLEIPSVKVITTPPKSLELPSNKKSGTEEELGSPISSNGRLKKIRRVAEVFASYSQIETRKRKWKGRKMGLIKLNNKKNACKFKMMSSSYIHSLREPTHRKKLRKNARVVVESKKFIKRRTRHVTFSGKDNILGGSKKSSRMGQPQIENPCEIFTKVSVASSESSPIINSSTNHEIDINAMVVDITDASSSKNNQINDSHKKAPLVVMIDLNQDVEANSDDENFWGATHREVSINSTEIHQESGLPNTSTITPTERDFDLNSFYHMPENHCSPNNLSPGTSKSIDRVFICNPLNSKELVVEMHPKMNMTSGSDHAISAQKDVELDVEANHLEIISKEVFDAGSYQRRDRQSKWFLKQCNLYQKFHHELKYIGVTDSGTLSIQNKEVIEDEDGFCIPDSFKKAYYLREVCNVDCQLQPVGRTTMRLMGKNVVVDDSNNYCHACGRSKTDKDFKLEKNIPKHWIQSERSDMTSGSTNFEHKSAANERQIRYHDRESPKPSRVQISTALPHWLLHAKCSEGNHLASSPYSDPAAPYHVHNLPPAQIFALCPSSSQSSSIFTGTNSNSEVLMNNGK